MLLGINIHQEDHLITLSQHHYIEKLLIKFGMDNAKTVTTPMDPNAKLDSPDEDQNKFYTQGKNVDIILFGFAALIGCLMYLALGTRPDIAYAVAKLAQHTSDPKSIHWTALKRIF